MNKVDRALEIQVIDWLQWCEEIPSRKKDGPNIVSLALELLYKRKKRNKELSMIIRTMARAGQRGGCLKVYELYKKAQHLLEPMEVLRNETGSQPASQEEKK